MRIPAFPVALLLGFGLLAQTPAPPPIDNDQAHVIVAHDDAHKKGTLHQHKLDRVMIYLQAGRQQFVQDGKTSTLVFKAGDVKWSPAGGMHTSEIVSDQNVTIIEVEVKKDGDPSKTINTPLDPLKVDPKTYKLEFENSKVRVIRVKMAAGHKVPMHEHMLNRVVVYLSDQNGSMTSAAGVTTTSVHKPGEFSWGTPLKHQEQNLMDHPFEAIMVEFKS